MFIMMQKICQPVELFSYNIFVYFWYQKNADLKKLKVSLLLLSSESVWNSQYFFLKVLYNLPVVPVFFVGRHLTYEINFLDRYRTVQVIYLSFSNMCLSKNLSKNLTCCRIYKQRHVHSIFNSSNFLRVCRDTSHFISNIGILDFLFFPLGHSC